MMRLLSRNRDSERLLASIVSSSRKDLLRNSIFRMYLLLYVLDSDDKIISWLNNRKSESEPRLAPIKYSIPYITSFPVDTLSDDMVTEYYIVSSHFFGYSVPLRYSRGTLVFGESGKRIYGNLLMLHNHLYTYVPCDERDEVCIYLDAMRKLYSIYRGYLSSEEKKDVEEYISLVEKIAETTHSLGDDMLGALMEYFAAIESVRIFRGVPFIIRKQYLFRPRNGIVSYIVYMPGDVNIQSHKVSFRPLYTVSSGKPGKDIISWILRSISWLYRAEDTHFDFRTGIAVEVYSDPIWLFSSLLRTLKEFGKTRSEHIIIRRLDNSRARIDTVLNSGYSTSVTVLVDNLQSVKEGIARIIKDFIDRLRRGLGFHQMI